MSAVVQAYRTLQRSARLAFQGDAIALTAARTKIREGFYAKAAVDPASESIGADVQYALDVAQILRQNVVQGKREGDTYKLRIHEETERGDNDSVKFAGKKLGQGVKCCSSN